ncbi:MAG: AbrB/MazE/SpoVT family DNA-binding domain-containing protein [Anaerolineales bacterium]|nr:AbrB/MazE/SpoVT family DNA-binding domain-containing protein [Anaerolineales bacterium]
MTTVQMRGKGTITFPAKLRSKYNLAEGEVFTIIDLGGGSFLLKPKVLEVDVLSRRIAKRLQEEDIDIENWLETLRQERKKLVKETYGNSKPVKK